MGWSCTVVAGDVYKEWSDFCVRTTGTSNSYETASGTTLFFETGREQEDGAITGSVYGMDGSRHGSFRINADGAVQQYPKGLRAVMGK